MDQANIRPSTPADFTTIWRVINDGASAYRGHIPPDRLRDPYMSREELHHEIEAGVQFWCYLEQNAVVGVMGLQHVEDVTLIRHAYVLSSHQKRGIGLVMLRHLQSLSSNRPMLVGTWADATWAISFYQRHGFQLVDPIEKVALLKKYWQVPERQIDTSVVLVDQSWRNRSNPPPH